MKLNRSIVCKCPYSAFNASDSSASLATRAAMYGNYAILLLGIVISSKRRAARR